MTLLAVGFLTAAFATKSLSSNNSKVPLRHVLQPPLSPFDCSFSASINLSIFGQGAEITCTSTKPSCDQAINEVVRCVKLSKTRLEQILGF